MCRVQMQICSRLFSRCVEVGQESLIIFMHLRHVYSRKIRSCIHVVLLLPTSPRGALIYNPLQYPLLLLLLCPSLSSCQNPCYSTTPSSPHVPSFFSFLFLPFLFSDSFSIPLRSWVPSLSTAPSLDIPVGHIRSFCTESRMARQGSVAVLLHPSLPLLEVVCQANRQFGPLALLSSGSRLIQLSRAGVASVSIRRVQTIGRLLDEVVSGGLESNVRL